MNIKSKICYSGIVLFPLTLGAVALTANEFNVEIENWLPVISASLLPTLYTYSINSMTYANGKREYGLFDAFNWKSDPYSVHSAKRKAMYPMINKNLLTKTPDGIILGKNSGKYVAVDLKSGGAKHCIAIGTSGCGKTSSFIIPVVLANHGIGKMVVDIKGEISEKGEKIDDPDVMIINPSNRKTYGYDPLYMLKDNASEQEIIDALSNITYSIMPRNSDEKNVFWSNSARDMFMGLSLFYIKNGYHDFIGIVDEILEKPISEAIEAVMNESDNKTPEYRYIVKFHKMADETLSGVYAQLSNSLTLFSNDYDIRHCLSENPLKVTPEDLNRGKSIYLVIKEEKISQYTSVLHMIINQTLAEMEKRDESFSPVMVIIDELARLTSVGRIYKLTDALATLRSRNVSLLLATQSIEALEGAYSRAEVSSIMTNISYKLVLQASSSATQKDIIGWCGKYKEYKETFGRKGSGINRSTTYEDKDIVDGADLIALPNTGDAILISSYGYNRFKKCPYYEDKILKNRANDIRTYNEKIKKIGG